jgi:hypothetical protein
MGSNAALKSALDGKEDGPPDTIRRAVTRNDEEA